MDFYKRFFIVVGFLFLFRGPGTTKGQQTFVELTNFTNFLNEVSFSVSIRENLTDIDVTLVDAYDKNKTFFSEQFVNETEYFVTISNLTSGSLYTVIIADTNNETSADPFNLDIATKPDAIKNLKEQKILFTSANLTWDKYLPPQNKTQPQYEITFNGSNEKINENYKNYSQLKPNTTYKLSVLIQLYNLSSLPKSINFTTLAVLPPVKTSVFAVNTSALNVTWEINNSSSIYPEYVAISLKNQTFKCLYKNKSCVIEIDQIPGTNHTLNISSVEDTYSSDIIQLTHPTKPLPPNCSVVSTSSSLSVNCIPDKSNFDFYLIYLYDQKNNSINSTKIPKNENANVTAIFENLQPNSHYSILVGTSSGTELSENSTIMFYTNPTLDKVNITSTGNTVKITWNETNLENCNLCLYNNLNSRCKNVSGKNVSFNNIRAGMVYNVNVSCNGGWSNPRKVIIPPLPPSNIQVSQNTDSFNVSWQFDFTNSNVDFFYLSVGKRIIKISGNTTFFKVENLTSGTDYNVSVWSNAFNTNSSNRNISTKSTQPECITTLSKVSFTNSSISLNLSNTSNSFDKYKFILQSEGLVTNNTKTVTNTTENVTFNKLEAGTKYNISVSTIKGTLQSEPCKSTITARTKPNAPTVQCRPSVRQIDVTLKKGQGRIDGFEVICDHCDNFTKQVVYSNDSAILNITQLEPYQMYFIRVRTFAGNLSSEAETCNSTTNETAPSEIQNLNIESINDKQINVTWEKPQKENGRIRFYMVSYRGEEVGTNKIHTKNLNTSKEFWKINVRPGYKYSISVTPVTIAPGPERTISFISKSFAPGFKPNISKQYKQANQSDQPTLNSFTVEFPMNPFSEDNGHILNYTVIVATSNDADTQASVLPNWYQFNENSSIKAYQVISNCTNLYDSDNSCNEKRTGRAKRSTELSPVKFKIGAEDCSKENTSYCNGFLKPNTNYYVKVRAYTLDAFQDTPFSEAIRTETEKTGLPSWAIALAILCSLITVLLIGLAFYCIRKRKLPKTSKVEKDFNMPRFKPTSHPVNLVDFRDHVIRMSSDSDIRFAEEYEDLKDAGKENEWVTAQLMCNRNKNRFANILPYDHSRVKLSSVDDEEGSDYINANYLPGFNSRREYIVTQGPLCSTCDDFWRMVSEQNVHNIVMLTKCVEKLREKCHHYWPESGDPMFYGDVQVAKMHETITPDWVITEFKITVGEKSRNLRHFHFTSWPDFGVPNSPQVIVNFVETVRRSLIKTGPIVVHCSAGVGRSGTFIAVDHCMQHIKDNDSVDVLGTVYEMRKNRVLMVQTEQQYIYIHHCLLNALEASENEDIYQNVILDQNGGHDNQAFLEDDEGIQVV